MGKLLKNIPHSQALRLRDLVDVEAGRVNSLTLSQQPGCKITVFAIDADEGMSSHAASGDAMVTVLEGCGEIVIEGEAFALEAGETLVISAGAAHSVRGITPFKMLLTVVRPA